VFQRFEQATLHFGAAAEGAHQGRVVAETRELERHHRLDHAGIIEQPGQILAALGIVCQRADAGLRIEICQIEDDGGGFRDQPVTVKKRRHFLVGMRIVSVLVARAVLPRDVGVDDLAVSPEFLDQPDNTRGARARRVIETKHGIPLSEAQD
jgi:hypothetical protein